MSRVLLVVSEAGYWGEECIEPLNALDSVDVEVAVATPSGGPPVIDDQSLDPEMVGDQRAEYLESVHRTDERLNDPMALASAADGTYDGVVFPGGHGTVWDVNQDHHARALLRETVDGAAGVALVVCHAVGLLAFTRSAEGSNEYLATDRSVTGFPNEWERDVVDENECLPDGRKLPYWVEDEVKAVGANWDAELDADESVTADGDLLTARGPESSSLAAETFLEHLFE